MNNTERRLERYRASDRWPAEESVQSMLDNQAGAVFAVRRAVAALAQAAIAASQRLETGHGRLIYAGAGASGRLAVQDGIELLPTFSWPKERVAYLLAGGEPALTRSIEGAEDDADAGRRAICDLAVSADDVIVALAASGATPFTVAVAQSARELGALTITFANNEGADLLGVGDINIMLDTGPEFLAGSTRMTAGTAQKIALNLFSTQLMIELGRVHDGWMVDVMPVNAKLITRSKHILQSLTGAGEDRADRLWRQSGGQLKVAVLMADGAERSVAEYLLSSCNGKLGRARHRLNDQQTSK